MKVLMIAAAAALLLAAGGDAQSWIGSLKSWLRPSRQTRPQNGLPPQNFPQASQQLPTVQQQGQRQQGFQVKVNREAAEAATAAGGDVARVGHSGRLVSERASVDRALQGRSD